MHIFQLITTFAFAWTIARCDKKPWVHHPTSTHPHINPAPTLYLGKPQAGTAIDVLNNHHDWSECINMHIRRRDVSKSNPLPQLSRNSQATHPSSDPSSSPLHHTKPLSADQTQLFTIPSQLPDTILSTLQCNAAPVGKSNDVHCGNVFNVLTTYCRVHILDWDRFEVGNQTFLHRHYMRGLPNALHLAYMRRNHQDDFNVTVTKVETPCNATEKAWKKHTPDMFDRCFQSLWGTWTGCKFSSQHRPGNTSLTGI